MPDLSHQANAQPSGPTASIHSPRPVVRQDWGIELAERGLLPDWLLRRAIDQACRKLLRELRAAPVDDARFADRLRQQPIAIETAAANAQHYEVPAAFFGHCLGPHRKYSSGYWPEGVTRLAEAEAAALAQSCKRAELRNGQSVLDVGCGWGSLSLWIAEHYPDSEVQAVSNSASQRQYIEREAKARGLGNLRVTTADINGFSPEGRLDRIVSLEALEHMRNYELLFARFTEWLKPGGKAFIHIFVHRDLPFEYDPKGGQDWMATHFFTGGQMPSRQLFRQFDRDLSVEAQWSWNGRHYARTARAWLENLDRNRAAVMPVLAECYGAANARRWFHRWRLFFLTVERFFGLNGGKDWFVEHYRLVRRRDWNAPGNEQS